MASPVAGERAARPTSRPARCAASATTMWPRRTAPQMKRRIRTTRCQQAQSLTRAGGTSCVCREPTTRSERGRATKRTTCSGSCSRCWMLRRRRVTKREDSGVYRTQCTILPVGRINLVSISEPASTRLLWRRTPPASVWSPGLVKLKVSHSPERHIDKALYCS